MSCSLKYFIEAILSIRVKKNIYFCCIFILCLSVTLNTNNSYSQSAKQNQRSIDEYKKHMDKELKNKIKKQLKSASDKSGHDLKIADDKIYKSIKKQKDNSSISDRKIPLVLDLDDDSKKKIKNKRVLKVKKDPSLYKKKQVIMSPQESLRNQRLRIHRKEMTYKRNRANFKRFWKKANAGDTKAQLKIGKMFLTGLGVTANTAEGQKWLEKSAKGGYVRAQTELGDMYSKRKFYKNSLYWYEQGALQNDGRSLFRLGEMYADGEGVKVDKTRSAEYTINSANMNFPDAQLKLFYKYSMGDGVVQDPIESYKWGMIAVSNRVKDMKKTVSDYGLSLSIEQRKEALKRYSAWRKERHKPIDRTYPK